MTLASIKPYAKAVVAFLVPTAGSLVGAMQDNTPGGSAITTAEWIGALIIGATSSGFVYGVPNKDPRGLHQEESTQPPVEGMGSSLIARHFAEKPGEGPDRPNPYWDGI